MNQLCTFEFSEAIVRMLLFFSAMDCYSYTTRHALNTDTCTTFIHLTFCITIITVTCICIRQLCYIFSNTYSSPSKFQIPLSCLFITFKFICNRVIQLPFPFLPIFAPFVNLYRKPILLIHHLLRGGRPFLKTLYNLYLMCFFVFSFQVSVCKFEQKMVAFGAARE